MTDIRPLDAFERRVADELERYASAITDPTPPGVVAQVAMGHRRGLASRLGLAGWMPVAMRAVAVAALVGLALLALALIAGGRRPSPFFGTLAFPMDGPGGTTVVALDPGGTRVIAPASSSLTECPTWSPDGARLAWLDGGSLRVANADGTVSTMMGAGTSGRLAWSPDGTSVAVVDGGGDATLRVVTTAAGTVETVLRTVVDSSSAPWSPDGTRIAVITGDGLKAQLVTMRPDGTDPNVVASLHPADVSSIGNPGYAWAPDGSAIVFGDRDRLWRVSPDGGSPVSLTDAEPGARSPAWSPDSTRLAFVTVPATADPTVAAADLWAVTQDGRAPTHLARLPAGIAGAPSWAPDGRSVAVAVRSWAGGGLVYRILVVPVDGAPIVEAGSFKGIGPTAAVMDCPVSWRPAGGE